MRIMTRHVIREHLFRLLFESDFHEEHEFEEQFDNYWSLQDDEPDDREYGEIKSKLKSIIEKKAEIDALIEKYSEGWSINRICNADLNILRVAIYEMKWDGAVPVKVAINEAVELAKVYGMDKSPSFINGILANVVKELGEDN